MSLEINSDLFKRMEADLKKVQFFNRTAVAKKVMARPGDIVKRRTFTKLPPPGYPGDIIGKVPLRDVLKRRVIQWASGRITVLVAFHYNRGAKHAHLVEHGHRMVPHTGKRTAKRLGEKRIPGRPDYNKITGGRVEGKKHLENAAKESAPDQVAAITKGLAAALPKGTG